jgi:hypothetical protein
MRFVDFTSTRLHRRLDRRNRLAGISTYASDSKTPTCADRAVPTWATDGVAGSWSFAA